MLPITTHRSSLSTSPLNSPTSAIVADPPEKPKRSFLLQRLVSSRPKPSHIALGSLTILLLWFWFKPRSHHIVIAPLSFTGVADNWGDYVAQGHARPKVIESTPSGYADLGNRRGALYSVLGVKRDKTKKDKDEAWERERRGVLGGGSVQWSEGVVGMGSWLGETVDMKKYKLEGYEDEGEGEVATRRDALTSHILSRAWVYLDEEDKTNTQALLMKAKKDDTRDKLPLRDRVRGDPELEQEAAESWSRVYAAMLGEGGKSALEVQVEKTVRTWPVVMFGLTDCEYVSLLHFLALQIVNLRS